MGAQPSVPIVIAALAAGFLLYKTTEPTSDFSRHRSIEVGSRRRQDRDNVDRISSPVPISSKSHPSTYSLSYASSSSSSSSRPHERSTARSRTGHNDTPKQGNDTDTCTVCLDEFQIPPSATSLSRIFLPCAHGFHLKCLQEWQKECRTKNQPVSCPICRTATHSANIGSMSHSRPSSSSTPARTSASVDPSASYALAFTGTYGSAFSLANRFDGQLRPTGNDRLTNQSDTRVRRYKILFSGTYSQAERVQALLRQAESSRGQISAPQPSSAGHDRSQSARSESTVNTRHSTSSASSSSSSISSVHVAAPNDPPIPGLPGRWLSREEFRGKQSFGWYYCNCHRFWQSCLARKDKWQKCKGCNHKCMPLYLWENDRRRRRDDRDTNRDCSNDKPHEQELCQRCGELGHGCWLENPTMGMRRGGH